MKSTLADTLIIIFSPALFLGGLLLGAILLFGPDRVKQSGGRLDPPRPWPIPDPYVNIEVGVRALRGRDQNKVLRRYNPRGDGAYRRAVFAYARRLREGKGWRKSSAW